MPDFPDPESRNALAEDCRRCPALAECRERIAWGNGPADASLVVVGEAPAAGDPDADRWRGGNLTGLAYTSRRSGRKIREVVADAGYAGDAYYTNAVKCFPADPADPGDNREPTTEERANCRSYLVEEIEAVGPTAVLATGKHATKSVLAVEGRELEGFLDSVLEPVGCERLGTTLVPLVHPSYQEVWIGRLGYSRAEYVEAIRETVAAVDRADGDSGVFDG
ncbi:uracil-DNA glycosylase [Halosimplex pelagicum]|uniref:Uracil-DNA glycosylase n=1 Tax=Halosimplex pelagicum TaxID=869886 RepID=A0A7D5T9B8_9EURY|nr:uracil-DNA glycosylase family protein [Halosimplex pelagicum]QLH80413.1 uracil-DNA glycosylase [Halosimplex pelagicum]